jgi:hypothetical protein
MALLTRVNSFWAGSRDGAHSSAMPVVPWEIVTIGRPSAGASAVGTEARPVTAIGSPASDSDRYMIRYAVAPGTSRSSSS